MHTYIHTHIQLGFRLSFHVEGTGAPSPSNIRNDVLKDPESGLSQAVPWPGCDSEVVSAFLWVPWGLLCMLIHEDFRMYGRKTTEVSIARMSPSNSRGARADLQNFPPMQTGY